MLTRINEIYVKLSKKKIYGQLLPTKFAELLLYMSEISSGFFKMYYLLTHVKWNHYCQILLFFVLFYFENWKYLLHNKIHSQIWITSDLVVYVRIICPHRALKMERQCNKNVCIKGLHNSLKGFFFEIFFFAPKAPSGPLRSKKL